MRNLFLSLESKLFICNAGLLKFNPRQKPMQTSLLSTHPKISNVLRYLFICRVFSFRDENNNRATSNKGLYMTASICTSRLNAHIKFASHLKAKIVQILNKFYV